MKYLIIFLLFLTSCAKEVVVKEVPYTGTPKTVVDISTKQLGRRAVHCLRDFITGEDPAGTWTKVSGPDVPALTGDNPCFDWSSQGCGLYTFRYKIVTTCCSDSTDVNVLKCCLNPLINCQ